ncbi:MAG: prolipoprotein diacylglyceryl transferase [Lachnospiraceae bacterium]|nr:prolipoprotein diacylglyceryl transferase [Lachnospiraceae bacterium]
MNMQINFPNLGIFLENVGKNFSVFGFEVAFYGCTMATGILVGYLLAAKEAKRTGQNPDDYLDMLLYAVFFGLMGARIYYVAFKWDYYGQNLMQIFNLRQGGIAIYGAIIGAFTTVYFFAKKRKLSWLQMLDTACPGLAAGQVIGRWGNFFNREAFGDYTDGLFAMQLPVSAVRSGEITEKMWEHMEVINGIQFIQVHPTFLYEGLWNLGVILFLYWYRDRKKFMGERVLWYVVLYGIGRFWIESLRTDQLLIPGIGFPISQLLGAVLAVGGSIMIYLGRRKARENN